ncbi:Rpn family recombination-promoting nuclease/putative transposase [Cohnella sp. GCM10027633]|uniref:Rpn family recombination-promoting nuclease/putative transposase n=1 Tax=unclassified Cohnella TaxID=2636738 RepID=UPI0036318F2A
MRRMESEATRPHDEAFKKLLQTFFAEFIALFFPELDRLLDHSRTRLLMQELLVDIVGEEARTLDLLVETRYRDTEAYVLVHLEPQSYRQEDFAERMFIYFGRLFERHRKEHRLILPIAVFTADDGWEAEAGFEMSVPGRSILSFRYWSVSLRKQDWRKFVLSDNPVAAALLANMGYNKKEKRELRIAYLRMILRLKGRIDDARLALIMSVSDIYYEPNIEEDESILRELLSRDPDKEEKIMELMPAWKRWGIEEGMEKGLEKGREEGRMETQRAIVIRMSEKGATANEIADIVDVPVEEIVKWLQE